jgi:hypothetical protein
MIGAPLLTTALDDATEQHQLLWHCAGTLSPPKSIYSNSRHFHISSVTSQISVLVPTLGRTATMDNRQHPTPSQRLYRAFSTGGGVYPLKVDFHVHCTSNQRLTAPGNLLLRKPLVSLPPPSRSSSPMLPPIALHTRQPLLLDIFASSSHPRHISSYWLRLVQWYDPRPW